MPEAAHKLVFRVTVASFVAATAKIGFDFFRVAGVQDFVFHFVPLLLFVYGIFIP